MISTCSVHCGAIYYYSDAAVALQYSSTGHRKSCTAAAAAALTVSSSQQSKSKKQTVTETKANSSTQTPTPTCANISTPLVRDVNKVRILETKAEARGSRPRPRMRSK